MRCGHGPSPSARSTERSTTDCDPQHICTLSRDKKTVDSEARRCYILTDLQRERERARENFHLYKQDEIGNLDHVKRSYYRAANAIFGRIGRIASEEVIIQLIKSKCIPVLV